MKYLAALAPICALLFSAACSQSPEKLLATANKYHQNKEYKKASILYQKVIAKDKTNGEAYYREGLNLLDDRQPGQAAGFLRRAVDLKPDNVDAATKLAEIYLTVYSTDPNKYKNLLPEVRDLSTKVLSHDPNSYTALRLEALVALADKDVDKALAAFNKANQIQPHSRDLVGWYAQTLVAAQHPDQAMSLVQDMLAHDKTWGPGYQFLFLQYSRNNETAKAEATLRDRVTNDPTSPAATTDLANYLLASNRFNDAEPVIRKLLDNKQTFPNARQVVGDFYVRAKKYPQALEQYNAGLSENPKLAVAYQERIVAVDEMTGKRDEAMQLAKNAAAKNPKDATANEVYASLLLQRGSQADLTKSLAELKDLVAKNPNNAVLHQDLARAYFGLNQMDHALSESLEAIRQNSRVLGARIIAGRVYEDRGQHGKAIEQAETVLASEPANPEAQLIHARAQIGSGQVDKGESELQTLVTNYPQMTDAHLVLAGIYIQQKAFDKATEEYNKVWKSNTPDERGFIGLQTVKLAQGNAAEAIQGLQDQVNRSPASLPLRFQLANFQAIASGTQAKTNPEQGKQWAQASIDNFKEILKTQPKSEDVWIRLGVVQRQMGQYDAALASFEQASNIDPRSSTAYLNQAVLFEALGKTKDAASAYNKTLGIDPQNTLALNNLAFLNAESGTNLDQAMTFAQKAQRQVPNSPDVSDTLGFVYYQKNLNSEALQMFRKAVQDVPQNPTFRFHLAMALLKQGDKLGAREEAEKALRNAPPQQQDKIRSFVGQIG